MRGGPQNKSFPYSKEIPNRTLMGYFLCEPDYSYVGRKPYLSLDECFLPPVISLFLLEVYTDEFHEQEELKPNRIFRWKTLDFLDYCIVLIKDGRCFWFLWKNLPPYTHTTSLCTYQYARERVISSKLGRNVRMFLWKLYTNSN